MGPRLRAQRTPQPTRAHTGLAPRPCSQCGYREQPPRSCPQRGRESPEVKMAHSSGPPKRGRRLDSSPLPMRRAALAALAGAETGPSAPSLARTLAAPPIARDVRGLCIVTGAAPLGDSSLDTWYHRPSRPTACCGHATQQCRRLQHASSVPLQPPKLAKSSPRDFLVGWFLPFASAPRATSHLLRYAPPSPAQLRTRQRARGLADRLLQPTMQVEPRARPRAGRRQNAGAHYSARSRAGLLAAACLPASSSTTNHELIEFVVASA